MQIFSKYFHNWDQQKYLDFCLEGYVQLVPLIDLIPFRSLVELQLILRQFQLLQQAVFNSYPNMNWKWNCKRENPQIFSSGIFLAWENGRQGHHFGQSFYLFLKGLTQSALSIRHHCIALAEHWAQTACCYIRSGFTFLAHQIINFNVLYLLSIRQHYNW